jgi:hypothetical protein
MNNNDRDTLIKTSWELHALVERSYSANVAAKNSDQWLEKNRLLLADMAIHLLQTAIKPGELEISRLKQNIYAVLVVTDDFMPDCGLKNYSQVFLHSSSAVN